LNTFVIEDSDTLRKKILSYLREKILGGAMSPDERLIETRIAKEIGVSRTPVREALHSLEQERLVKAIPRVGYVVTRMQQEEVEEICEIRIAIEGLAIKRAIERAQEQLAKDLRKNILRQRNELSKGNLRAYVELDAQFHEVSAALSGSSRLLEMALMLRRHMLRFRIQALYIIETALKSLKGHERILEAVEKGDPKTAIAVLEQHLKSAKNDVLQYGLVKPTRKNLRQEQPQSIIRADCDCCRGSFPGCTENSMKQERA
jgi:GntR family transcriptional regulator, rspAB operon transcriptional repressor